MAIERLKELIDNVKRSTEASEVEKMIEDILEIVGNVADRVAAAKEIRDAFEEKINKLKNEKDEKKSKDLAGKALSFMKVIDKHFASQKEEVIQKAKGKLKDKAPATEGIMEKLKKLRGEK